MKEVIREVIVVEGTHDSARLKEFFDCETIVTGGLGMRDGVLEAIKAAQTIKYAVVIVAIVPMMIVYPFLQRFFVQGVMIGSIKG